MLHVQRPHNCNYFALISQPCIASSVVILIYFQLQLISEDFETVTEKDLEFFFRRDKPIMGWDGHPHPNPKV